MKHPTAIISDTAIHFTTTAAAVDAAARVRKEMKNSNSIFFLSVFSTMFSGKCASNVELRSTAFQNQSTIIVPGESTTHHQFWIMVHRQD